MNHGRVDGWTGGGGGRIVTWWGGVGAGGGGDCGEAGSLSSVAHRLGGLIKPRASHAITHSLPRARRSVSLCLSVSLSLCLSLFLSLFSFFVSFFFVLFLCVFCFCFRFVSFLFLLFFLLFFFRLFSCLFFSCLLFFFVCSSLLLAQVQQRAEAESAAVRTLQDEMNAAQRAHEEQVGGWVGVVLVWWKWSKQRDSGQ
jgi:hypothetical protein